MPDGVEIDLLPVGAEAERAAVRLLAYPRVGDEIQMVPGGPGLEVLRVVWLAWLPGWPPVVLARPR